MREHMTGLGVVMVLVAGVVARGAAPDKVSRYDQMPQVLMPAGPFTMGADDADAHGRTAEFPPHRVHLAAYWIDRHEVTNAQFVRFLNARTGGSRRMIYGLCDLGNPACRIRYDAKTKTCVVAKGYELHPVCAVSWHGAHAYARFVRRRLPTEAEWERAARGTDGRRYPWGTTWDPAKTNTREAGAGHAVPVGTMGQDRSPCGAMDMAGNVREWVQDVWDADFYLTSPMRNPVCEGPRTRCVVRGGAWCLTEWDARTTSRQVQIASSHRRYMGFRCAETVPAPLPPPIAVSKDVLFYAPMDGHVHAAAARGSRRPFTAPKHPTFVPGRRGQAVVLGDSGPVHTWIDYDAEANWRGDQGTVALWIQLRGWKGADPGFRYFFMIRDEATCKFYVYRYLSKDLLVLAGNGIEGQWGSVGTSTQAWKDGQWVHVAVTWQDRWVTLYVDGKQARRTRVPPEKYFRGMPPAFTIGHCQEWGRPMKADTAFDELVIFSRALSPAEIVAERDRAGAP